jgi:hypothetical protein
MCIHNLFEVPWGGKALFNGSLGKLCGESVPMGSDKLLLSR